MATRKINQVQPSQDIEVSEPTSSDANQISIPDGFPPKGMYTAKAIADDFGFDPSGIEKYYYPEALDLYQVCPQVLRAGHLYTQTFYDLMFLFRQNRMREKLLLNSKGQVVRHAGESGKLGKPVLEKNETRMTAQDFKSWYWEQKPELIPLVAENSVEAVEQSAKRVEAEIVPDYSTPEYDEQTNLEIDGTLAKTEEFGNTFQNFKSGLIRQFRLEGRAIAAEGVQAMQEEIASTMNDFFTTLKSSTNTTKKQ